MRLRNSLLTLLTTAILAAASDPAVELEAAVRRETVQGDLKAAAEAYRRIVANAGKNREVAARALLRLAMVYRKQGDSQARQTLDRLLRDFADQPGTVAEARAELARLTPAKGNETTLIRHFSPAAAGCMPHVLGARVTDCHRPEGIFIHDLQTGRERLVVPQSRGRLLPGAISPDEKTLTYFDLSSGLRAVGTDGSTDRLLVTTGSIGGAIQNAVPLLHQRWMKDGARLLVYRPIEEGGGGSFDLQLVSVVDGKTQSIRRVEAEIIGEGALSPDDRFVALSQYSRSQETKILVVPLNGGQPAPLNGIGTVRRLVGWHPSGRILYTSDQSGGSVGIWAIRVEEGKAAGTPELVHAGLHPATRPWVGRDAAIHFEEWGGPILIQTATLDAAGQLSVPRTATKLFTNGSWSPNYSADGKAMIYASAYAPATVKFVVQDLANGKETAYAAPYRSVTKTMWDQDNSSLLVYALPELRASWGLYRFVPATGESKLLAANARPFSRSGQSLYFTQNDIRPGTVRQMNTKTGESREIALPGNPEEVWGVEVSPNGLQVAFGFITGGRNGNTHLAMASLSGGNVRTLFEHKRAALRNVVTMCWTADGEGLLYSLPRNDRGSDLWHVPADGGPPRRLRSFTEEVAGIAVHPNGRDIALSTREHNGGKFWVIENAFAKSGN